MAITLGNTTWSPSEFQKDIPLDSGQPGNSALQRVADAENRSWLDCNNYLFAFPRREFFVGPDYVVLNPSLTRTIFRFRAHNPVGLVDLRLIVRGSYAGGTGASLLLDENGTLINTVALTTTITTITTLAPVLSLGDVVYTIRVSTNAGSTATVREIWLGWGAFT
jgi:hypothetical protein